MEKADRYLEALEHAASIAKSAVVISAAPLALLFSQARLLLQIDFWPLKLLVTVAGLALFYALFLAWGRAQLVLMYLAKETLCAEGTPKEHERGGTYLRFAMSSLKVESKDFDEEFLVEHGKHIAKRFNAAAGLGYLCLVMSMLVVIWI